MGAPGADRDPMPRRNRAALVRGGCAFRSGSERGDRITPGGALIAVNVNGYRRFKPGSSSSAKRRTARTFSGATPALRRCPPAHGAGVAEHRLATGTFEVLGEAQRRPGL